MKTFEQRWQRCVARARDAVPPEAVLPFGFIPRVLAARRAAAAPAIERAWERLALGSLAAVLAVLVLCAALELPHLRDAHPLNPGVENVVAQLVWRL